jgi:hypothetical protein
LALLALASVSLAQAGEVEISLSIHGQPPAAPLPVQVRAVREASGGQEEKVVTAEVSAAAGGRLALEPAGIWQVTAEAAGYWIPKTLIGPGDTGATLHLWPLGAVSGRVQAVPQEKLPAELTVRFRSTPEPGKQLVFPEQTVACPISEGAFSCPLPAGKLDLRLRARGFVSHFRWGVEVPAGKPLPLGGLALKRGASVVGRVEVAEGRLSPKDCQVELSPMQAGSVMSPADSERRENLVLTETVDGHGFFQLEGVSPGSYVLTARQSGYAPAEMYPVSVLEGAESEVRQPLVLHRALALEVVLDPPLDPWNGRWVVEVTGKSPVPFSARTLGIAERTDEGRYARKNLSPGDYFVEVRDSKGSAYASAEWTLTSSSAPLEIRLPLVWIDGRIRLGEEPLAANLWFGGQAGRERISFRADGEGEFSGVLPHGGTWEVDVESSSPRVRRRVREVQVEPGRDGATARVRIDLPNTKVTGEVVDEKGARAPNVQVRALDLVTARPTVVNADENGRFELHAVPEGPFTLIALKAEARSDEALVQVTKDVESPPVRLVLRKVETVTGLVLAGGGAVPGARVLALPRNRESPSFWPGKISATTDVEGRFSLKVPAGTTDLQVEVLAPGRTLALRRFQGIPKEPLQLDVSAPGGVVELVMPGGDLSDPAAERLTVWVNGLLLDGTELEVWAALNGAQGPEPGILRVPSLPEGSYTACWSDLAAAFDSMVQGGPSPGAACSTGILTAGGSLRLERPRAQAAGSP